MEEWYDGITASIIVNIVVAGILTLTAVFLGIQLRRTEDNQYVETLRNCMNDLYQIYHTDFKVTTKAECELLAIRILDILAILAHLKLEKKLDKKILDFIRFDLQIGKRIMKWFNDKKLAEKYNVSSSEEIWANLDKYLEENKIEECNEDVLPRCIRDFDNLFPIMVFVYGTLTDQKILKNLIGRNVSGTQITLDGYDDSKRIIIENQPYRAAEKKLDVLFRD